MQVSCLSGVRVIEFSLAAAGPVAGMFLGFLGAEVIKVESKTRLDQARRRSHMIVKSGPKGELADVSTVMDSPDASPDFNCRNLGKLGITVDMKKLEGLSLVKQLAKVSDVLLSNFRPGVMDKLGLSYEALRQIKPDIIVLASSAVGSSGPDGMLPGYASIFGAIGGLSYLTGHAKGTPKEMRVPMDIVAGATSALYILAALNYRQATGRGQYIDLSSAESISLLAGDAIMDYQLNRRSADKQGNRDSLLAPQGCYKCKGQDEWLTIAIGSDQEWEAFCNAIGKPEMAKDERFYDPFLRHRHHDVLDKIIERWSSKQRKLEAMSLLQKAGVAAVATYNARDLFEDRHLVEREAFASTFHPVIGRQTVLAPPWKLSNMPVRIPGSSPLVGEHNQYVFRELLGYSQEAFAQLETAKILN
ncbi:MAG: CoA transferase [Chloroflexi bacterium]|nr:CoA transferase [Chloroflexota bacterium]